MGLDSQRDPVVQLRVWSLKAGVECVEVVWQVVCRADGAAAGGPVVCDVLQAPPHPPRVSSGIDTQHVSNPSVCPGLLVGELSVH